MSQLQSEAGPSRRRGKYAPRACNNCRRRKCKCDGVHPICQPCAASGYECSWTPEGELDRPVTKQLIEGLRAKVHHLEAEIAQLKQPDTLAATLSSPSGPRPDTEFSPVIPQPTLPSGSLSSGNIDPNVKVEHVLSQSPFKASLRPHFTTRPDPGLTPLHPHIDTAPTTDNHTPTPPNEPMASPVGTPSSFTYQYIFNIDVSLPLDEQPPEHRASLQCEWDRYLPDLGDIQLSRQQHDMLLSRCFSYGAAWIFGLLPNLFLRDMLEYLSPNSARAPGELQHYCPLLHCSLLAFASPLSDNPDFQQPSTREVFATHAKKWLDEEFTYSNPSLVISLILLSEYHMGIGEKNTGYMYTGMSMRAVRAGTGSPLRDWYRWSTFIQEKMLAHEMNRPSEMPVPTISIRPPIADDLPGESLSVDSITDLFAHEDYAGIALECFVQCAKLMSIPASASGSTVSDTHHQLDTWFSALPYSLHIHQSERLTPPPVFSLHIRYWWSILQLYPSNNNDEPSQFMILATEKLVQLFSAFDTQFGFEYFPRNLLKAVYTCGRTLIFERTSEDGVDICLKGLHAWSCAEPLLQDLIRLRSSMQNVDGVDTPDQ